MLTTLRVAPFSEISMTVHEIEGRPGMMILPSVWVGAWRSIGRLLRMMPNVSVSPIRLVFVFLWSWRDGDNQAATFTTVDNAALGPRRLHRYVTDGTRLQRLLALVHEIKGYRQQIGQFDLDQKGPRITRRASASFLEFHNPLRSVDTGVDTGVVTASTASRHRHRLFSLYISNASAVVPCRFRPRLNTLLFVFVCFQRVLSAERAGACMT